MRYTKLALLSTLSALALTTTSSPAFAPSVTDMGLLRPQNVWQVSDINAKNTSYCAMVGSFDKQISLAFARSPSGAGSLAIGFPEDILETGLDYQVALQVDDLQTRRYDVRAASPRSLIVQIGRDEEFYGALGNNGTLRILLPNADMRFDLAKFSGSYISLVSCANKLPHHEGPRTAAIPVTPVESTSLATPASTKKEAKTAAAAPVALAGKNAAHDPSFTWTRNQPAKTADIRPDSAPLSADAENVEMKSKLTQMTVEQTELASSVNLLKDEKNDLQTKLEMKDKQIEMLEASLNAKDKDLASVRYVTNKDSQTLASLQAEVSRLKHDRDQAVADLQMRLSDKTAQYNTLQKQFTDNAEARRTSQESAMQAQAEIETLRQRLTQAEEQISSAEQQKSDLSTQVQFEGEQNKSLLMRVQSQLSKATQQISLLESQLTSVSMQRDDLTAQLDAETNKNKALEADLEVKQRQLAYRTVTGAVPVATNVHGKDNMNLLGAGRNFAAAAPVPLPAIARDDLKGPAAAQPVDNWDTVVVQ